MRALLGESLSTELHIRYCVRRSMSPLWACIEVGAANLDQSFLSEGDSVQNRLAGQAKPTVNVRLVRGSVHGRAFHGFSPIKKSTY